MRSDYGWNGDSCKFVTAINPLIKFSICLLLSKHNELIGYVLMLVSIIFNGFFYAYEEYLLTNYHINFYQMVASEGIYGGTIILALTAGLSYVPCGLGERICVYDTNGRSYY